MTTSKNKDLDKKTDEAELDENDIFSLRKARLDEIRLKGNR